MKIYQSELSGCDKERIGMLKINCDRWYQNALILIEVALKYPAQEAVPANILTSFPEMSNKIIRKDREVRRLKE